MHFNVLAHNQPNESVRLHRWLPGRSLPDLYREPGRGLDIFGVEAESVILKGVPGTFPARSGL
jgi:hypothetical protein